MDDEILRPGPARRKIEAVEPRYSWRRGASPFRMENNIVRHLIAFAAAVAILSSAPFSTDIAAQNFLTM